MKARIAKKIMKSCVLIAGTEYGVHTLQQRDKARRIMRKRPGGWQVKIGKLLSELDARWYENALKNSRSKYVDKVLQPVLKAFLDELGWDTTKIKFAFGVPSFADDVIVLDDPYTPHEQLTPEQNKKITEWWEQATKPLGILARLLLPKPSDN